MPDSNTFGGIQNVKWNTPIGMLHSRTEGLDDYVLIGTKNGEPTVFASGDETETRDLLNKVGMGQRESASFGG